MNSQIHMFLLCLLTGSSCAVFYTKGKDTDYPRIGRRSFYTTGDGNHYPRIGRRSSLSNDLNTADFGVPPSGFDGLNKRGLFTDVPSGYPRVGRRSGPGSDQVPNFAAMSNNQLLADARRGQLLENLLSLKEELQTGDVNSASTASSGLDQDGEATVSGRGSIVYPLDIMFIAFDADNDGTLTKDEFLTGMQKYREENPMC